MGSRLVRGLGTLIVGLTAACATPPPLADDPSCQYVHRVGSRIPRRECAGEPVAQGGYGEINQALLQNTLARRTSPRR